MKKSFQLKTEVLPKEIPINFTNKNIFKLTKETKKFTIPLTFEIIKPNSINYRLISLPHPLAQIKIGNFLERYKFNITSFCSLSPYSIRSPYKINTLNYDSLKLQLKKINYQNENFLNIDDKNTNKITYNEIVREYSNFFTYRKFYNLVHFKNSAIFFRTASRFDGYIKLDIQNFFGSIYTHSLEWAIAGGKEKVKVDLKQGGGFLKDIDSICQLINYNETNGIIVGPEFSRVVSEILLTRIDMNIFRNLSGKGLWHNTDYVIYRYLDDYFLFYNNKKERIEQNITSAVTMELKKYNLNLNDSKYIKNLPANAMNDYLVRYKRIFENFQSRFNSETNSFNKLNYYSEFIIEFDNLLINYPNNKITIIRYSIKSFNLFLNKDLTPLERKLVFELLLYIINYSPEHFSARSFYTFFLKYNKIQLSKKTNIDDDIFQFMYKSIKQNQDNFKQIYDILTAMKFINKKLSSSFLCKLIGDNYDNYFVLCSIGLYILDESNKKIQSQYKTVLKKLLSCLLNFINNYESRSPYNVQDAKYFYLINDFYHYPGFYSANQPNVSIKKEFLKMRKELTNSNSFYLSKEESEQLTNSSYYNWNINYEWFIKESILKSANIKSMNLDSY